MTVNQPLGKTVGIYARVSTLDQNCDMQLADLRRYAGQRFGLCREFVDEGVSGTQRRRPQLDALMAEARRCRFDTILVWKFDRFARSLKHLIDSLDEFRERDLIAERVRAGMAHAKAMGKRIGRPRAVVDRIKVAELRKEGKSLRGIAKELGIPVSRVRRALATQPEEAPTRHDPESSAPDSQQTDA